jgi:TonB family protein
MGDQDCLRILQALHALERKKSGNFRKTRWQKISLYVATVIFAVVMGVLLLLDIRSANSSAVSQQPQLTHQRTENATKTIDTSLYVPPKVLSQTLPDTKLFPPDAKCWGTRMEIQVEIDEAGHVTSAHVVKPNASNKSDRAVVQATLSAAKQWIFQPAMRRGSPTASRHTIAFEFQR